MLVPRSLGCEVAQNHGHGQYDESGEGDGSIHLRANAYAPTSQATNATARLL
jgi:hypothetical protein